MATEETKPPRVTSAAKAHQIEEVEARLYRHRAETVVHAAAVGDRLRSAMTSPFTLVGAASLGFAVAWWYPRRRSEPEPHHEKRDTGEDQGASMLSTLMSGLNLAGMAMSLFPIGAGAAGDDADPR